jgi:hypothetical protein
MAAAGWMLGVHPEFNLWLSNLCDLLIILVG